jgi:SAM-dependent methyltransferase
MHNPETWQPSKYVYRYGKLRASRNPAHVSVYSLLMVDILAEFFDRYLNTRHVGGALLDLGCGRVPLYHCYSQMAVTVTCVDWKGDHLDLKHDLSRPLPYKNQQFNTIIASDVLEHLPAPERFWREMARVLAPGGTIIISVPFLYPVHEAPHDFYRYTAFALRRFVKTAGLELVGIESLGGAPEVLASIFAKTVNRVPIVGIHAARFAQWFVWHFRRTRLGRRVTHSTMGDFPLGYFLLAQKPLLGHHEVVR